MGSLAALRAVTKTYKNERQTRFGHEAYSDIVREREG